MAATVKHESKQIRVGDVAVGEVNRDEFTIKATGKPVSVPGNMYGETNFYIEQSKQYFPNRKFRKYVYFYFMHFLYPIIFLASLASPANYIYAFVMTGVNGIFLLFYIQHLHVIAQTLKYVMLQPSVPNNAIKLKNDHIVISIDIYRAQYAASSAAGIGIAVHGSGKIKIQIFKRSSKGVMKNTKVISIFSFIGASLMVLYCPAIGFWKLAVGLGN